MKSWGFWIIWGLVITGLSFVVFMSHSDLLLHFDMSSISATALLLILTFFLIVMPCMLSLIIETLFFHWTVFSKRKGAKFVMVLFALFSLASTIIALMAIVIMRQNLYEYGNVLYGQLTNWFALLAPFFVSGLVLITTYIFFPSHKIVDVILSKLDSPDVRMLMREVSDASLKLKAVIYDRDELLVQKETCTMEYERCNKKLANETNEGEQEYLAEQLDGLKVKLYKINLEWERTCSLYDEKKEILDSAKEKLSIISEQRGDIHHATNK